MQVQIVLDPVRDPLPCAGMKSVRDNEKCLAPARWRAAMRRGVVENHWTACDAHVFPVAQYMLHREIASEVVGGLIVAAEVGKPQ